MTEFRKIEGFDGYWVNDIGEIWSSKKQVSRGKYHGGMRTEIGDTPTKKLSPGLRNEYQFVVLTQDGKRHSVSVHKLVLAAFHGPQPFEKAICRHLDGNKQNNRANNLKWGTYKENTADAVKAGIRGMGGFNTNFTEADIIEIRGMTYENGLFTALAEKFQVTVPTISDAYYGKTWEHIPGANKPRLTDDDVRVIKSYNTYHGINQDLAAEYNVAPATISNIRNGRTWRHVERGEAKQSNMPRATLTDDQVRDIRNREFHHRLVSSLAAEYKMSTTAIRKIRGRKTYKHVK